jgi:hypothetical protein
LRSMWGSLVQFLAAGDGGYHGGAPGGLGLMRGGRSRWGADELSAGGFSVACRERKGGEGSLLAARGEERGRR